jgi:hypothetical protein
VWRARSALLWGLVGVVGFLALVQAYQLAGERLRIPLPALLGVVLLVGGVTTGVAYVVEPRLLRNGRS